MFKNMIKKNEEKISKRVKENKEKKVRLAIELSFYLLGEVEDVIIEKQAMSFMQIKIESLENSVNRVKDIRKINYNISDEIKRIANKNNINSKINEDIINKYSKSFGFRLLDL